VLVENLPITYKESNLSELFSSFGAVSGIELPLYDHFAEEAMLRQGKDPFTNQRREKERLDLLRSQNILRETAYISDEYAKVLTEYLGEEEAQEALRKIKVIPEQTVAGALTSRKMDSVFRIITQLQSEGKEVDEALGVITSLKTSINEIEDVPHLPSGT
jgi:hypothetical protein